jgi:hypothetical protein
MRVFTFSTAAGPAAATRDIRCSGSEFDEAVTSTAARPLETGCQSGVLWPANVRLATVHAFICDGCVLSVFMTLSSTLHGVSRASAASGNVALHGAVSSPVSTYAVEQEHEHVDHYHLVRRIVPPHIIIRTGSLN